MSAKTLDFAPFGRAAVAVSVIAEVRRQEALLKTGALQDAILNSANFSIIATDETGVIQLFNVGAERMLGYAAAEVVNQITPAHISDPPEVVARAVVDPARRYRHGAHSRRRLDANAMPRDIERGLQAGFFRYLTKPIKVNAFLDTLEVALKFSAKDASQSR